ncbi:hypothetical protein ACHAW6_013477 [Cyclotella cf. meneghiniana]
MTADCQICLSPLSSPWGVCYPCGHAYHRECWDALICTTHETSQKRKKKKCALCNGATKAFQQVFVELRGDDADKDVTEGDNGKYDGVNDDSLNDLKRDWEGLWQDLQALLLPDATCDHDSHSAGDEQDLIGTTNDGYHGTQFIQDICSTIDLTQSPTCSAVGKKLGRESQVPMRNFGQKTDSRHEELTTAKPLHQNQQKKTKIQHLLSKLHEIHTTLMDVAPSSTSKQNSHLKSKFLALRQTNSTLESQITGLKSQNSSLQSKLNRANQSLFDRNLETAREKRQAETMNEKYTQLLGLYSSYQDMTMRQMEDLKRSNAELRRKNEELKTVSGLADVKEMEEIQKKYTKMSQQVHDLTKENQVLTRRMEEMERRRAEYISVKNLASGRVEKRNNVDSDRCRSHSRDDEAFRSAKDSKSGKIGGKENNLQNRREGDASSGLAKRDSNMEIDIDLSLRFSNTSANKAMQILDMAPTRKATLKTMKPTSQIFQRGTSGGYDNRSSAINDDSVRHIDRRDIDEDDCDNSVTSKSEIQLFMKNPSRKHSRAIIRTGGVTNTGNIQPIQIDSSSRVPLHRQGSVNSTQSTTSQGKRRLLETGTVSRKSSKKGTVSQPISTFFKPVANSK